MPLHSSLDDKSKTSSQKKKKKEKEKKKRNTLEEEAQKPFFWKENLGLSNILTITPWEFLWLIDGNDSHNLVKHSSGIYIDIL